MTIWNLINFNIVKGGGALYGSYSFSWYIYSVVPLFFNIWLIPLVFGLCKCWVLNKYKELIWSILFTIFVQSTSAHKEDRYILITYPMLQFFCVYGLLIMLKHKRFLSNFLRLAAIFNILLYAFTELCY